MASSAAAAAVRRALPILLLSSYVTQQAVGLRPDRYCLSCLCTAATGCNPSAGCLPDGDSALCGPFYMSEPYWQDANITAPGFADQDFRSCANDVECAGEAVAAYMNNFSRDCDQDGQITCKDFALMHYLGYGPCEEQGRDSEFYIEFNDCMKRLAGLLEKEDYLAPAGYAPNGYGPAELGI